MELEQQILDMYFNQHLKQKEIAEKLNISKYIVSRKVSKDSRYAEEKIIRKNKNSEKHKRITTSYINKKREDDKRENAYMKQQHIQDRLELSEGKKPINNRAYRNWNSSIYEFDFKSKSYILKEGINVGADIPIKISWK